MSSGLVSGQREALSVDLGTDALFSSKHILNAQVSIRAPCCKQWYDCAECHAEKQDHRLAKTTEMAFMCKKCRKAFRKDMTTYEESDEFCPHCDNHYVRIPRASYPNSTLHDRLLGATLGSDYRSQVIEAKTPQAVLGVEGDDPRINARYVRLLCHAGSMSGTFLPGCSRTSESSKIQRVLSLPKTPQTGLDRRTSRHLYSHLLHFPCCRYHTSVIVVAIHVALASDPETARPPTRHRNSPPSEMARCSQDV